MAIYPWFDGLEAVCDDAGEDVDEGVDGRSMARVFQALDLLEDVEDSLQNETGAQREFVEERHEIVAHVLADAGDQLQSILPQVCEQ